MSFINPWALLLLPIAYIPFWLKSHQGQMYSWNEIIPEDVFSDRFNLAIKIITSLLLTSIVFAIAAPHGPDQNVMKVGKGAQTVMVIDRSVSMDHPFAGDSTSGRGAEIKSAAARRLISYVIYSSPDDMIGVFEFAKQAPFRG